MCIRRLVGHRGYSRAAWGRPGGAPITLILLSIILVYMYSNILVYHAVHVGNCFPMRFCGILVFVHSFVRPSTNLLNG